MLVYQAQLGDWDNLNHLLVCKKARKRDYDPFFAEYWKKICISNGWSLEQVWLTHSHWDHSKGVDGLQDSRFGYIKMNQKEAGTDLQIESGQIAPLHRLSSRLVN